MASSCAARRWYRVGRPARLARVLIAFGAVLLGAAVLAGCPSPGEGDAGGATAGGATAADATAEAVRRIEAMSAARAAAFNNEDADSIAAHFTDDAILMAPGEPAATGPAAVAAYYQSIFDAYDPTLESRYVEVEVSGDLAYGRGIARVTLVPEDGGAATTTVSKYLNIVARQPDGSWKTTHDIWNAGGTWP